MSRAVGGFAGVLFLGLSTEVVPAMSIDEIRARTLSIWAAGFVGAASDMTKSDPLFGALA